MIRQCCPPEARTSGGNIRYLDQLRELARKNRLNPTESENLFWRLLIKKDNLNYRFLRQKPIGRFILDFYCSKLLLAIEIDGDSHDKKKYIDNERDLYLEQRGIKTLRYRNEQILKDIKNVYKDLEIKLKQRETELTSILPCQREN